MLMTVGNGAFQKTFERGSLWNPYQMTLSLDMCMCLDMNVCANEFWNNLIFEYLCR